MARRCGLTGKGVQSGNQVSHSKRKTRRRFLPNIQNVSLISDILGVRIPLSVTASTLRSIEINGGLDAYILSTSNTKLTDEGLTLKKRLKKFLVLAEAAVEVEAA